MDRLAARAFNELSNAHRRFKVAAVAQLYPQLAGDARTRVMLREQRYDRTYLRRARQRLTQRIGQAQRDPNLTESSRQEAVRRALDLERRYLDQHIEATGRRMLREAEQAQLQASGDPAAYWLMDRSLRSHTTDCLAMEGRVWTWDVLKVINPANRHHGCGCRLISLAEARRRGLPLRRGYRSAAMRHAADLREALLAGSDPEGALLTETQAQLAGDVLGENLVEVWVGAYDRLLPSGKLVHVRAHERTTARHMHAYGDVRPSLEDDMERMISAHAAGAADDVEHYHRKLRSAALKIADDDERDENLRVIDRARAALTNPEGVRAVAGRHRLQPRGASLSDAIDEPWSERGTYAWMLPPGGLGPNTPQVLETLRKTKGIVVRKSKGGNTLIETAKRVPAGQARGSARGMEIMVPALRRLRAVSAGEYLDNDIPLDIGPGEPVAPGQGRLNIDAYNMVTWGQQGDAGELTINETAERLKQLKAPDVPADAQPNWPTRGQKDTPLDWLLEGDSGGLAFEVKTHAWRGTTPGRVDTRRGGPSISTKARALKVNELKARNQVRKKAGQPPLQAALAQVYVDFDDDVAHVFVQRYGKGDEPFKSRRMPVAAMQDLVDGNVTPGQTWLQERGPGSGDPDRATMYVGSWRLKFNPLRPADTGRRLTGEELEQRRAVTAPAADVYAGSEAIAPPDPINTRAQRAAAGGARRATAAARQKAIKAELKRVAAGKSTKTLGEIGADNGVSQARVSQIARDEGIVIGRGKRLDRTRERVRRLRKAA